MADENNNFKNYTGISFPFRVNKQGRVVMSSVDTVSAEHLNESIEQILHTSFGERVMESEIYSDIESSLFHPNDISLQSYLASKVVEALQLDERIRVAESDVSFKDEDGFLYATIKYRTNYNNQDYQVTVNLGEIIGGGNEDE